MRRIHLFFICLFFIPLLLQAQSGKDLRINEILVVNDSNYVDDFGQRSGWIEIFNSAYNPVDIGGMYLTNDPDNPRKYSIPKGDPRTVLPPRGYVVFFANNKPTHGIMHLNFELEASDVVALFDANGKTLVDKIKLPGEIRVDTTYGRIEDGGEAIDFLEKTTPKANNDTRVKVSAADKFGEMDPIGAGMAIIAMTVVFSSLALLYLVFRYITRVYTFDFRKLFAVRKKQKEGIKAIPDTAAIDLQGEVAAAIAVALSLYMSQLHDIENTVLTIKKVSRTYSPWSSKIYGLRNFSR
jgi:Na+-transporting methylmalonyl-CoA/oxaloacetate decarboxylase gamma subunit